MRFLPSQSDSPSSSWESALGLFSFQIGAVLVSSLVFSLYTSGSILSVFVSELLSVLAAFLYALLAESQVAGALRHPGCRRMLALRAAFLTGVVALAPMVAFRLIEVHISAPSLHDLYVVAAVAWGVFVVPWFEMWIGLGLGVWFKRRTSRS